MTAHYPLHVRTLLDQLNIQHPIFKAPMAGTSTPLLAAAVSNMGGLGALGLGAHNIEAARQDIQKLKTLTNKPFQVNFFCHQPTPSDPIIEQAWIDYLRPYFNQHQAEPPQQLKEIYPTFLNNESMLDLLLEERPPIVSFHFGIPTKKQIEQLKQAGIFLMASATSLPEAKLIEQAGLDAVVAQGVEAGGHRGMFQPDRDPATSTADLVKLFKNEINLPIIAAGGIMTGQDIQHMLNLGASAAQLGTAFTICPESAASPAYRQYLLNPAKQLTQITATISGRPARGLINDWQNLIDTPNRPEIAAYPYAYDLAKQLIAVSKKQHEKLSVMWAGSNVQFIRDMPADTLMQTLIAELAAA